MQYLDEVHYPGIYQLRVAVLDIDDDIVRYVCGLFDGPKCVGLAEAVGSCHATDADGKPVTQVFVLLVPEQATDQHLQLLSELAQMFSERTFRERLATAADPAALAHVFAEWEPR